MPHDWDRYQPVTPQLLDEFTGGQCLIRGHYAEGRILKGEIESVNFDRQSHKLIIIFRWLAHLQPPQEGEPLSLRFDPKSGKLFGEDISYEDIEFAKWVLVRDNKFEATIPPSAQLEDKHLTIAYSDGIIEFYPASSSYLLDPARVHNLV